MTKAATPRAKKLATPRAKKLATPRAKKLATPRAKKPADSPLSDTEGYAVYDEAGELVGFDYGIEAKNRPAGHTFVKVT